MSNLQVSILQNKNNDKIYITLIENLICYCSNLLSMYCSNIYCFKFLETTLCAFSKF